MTCGLVGASCGMTRQPRSSPWMQGSMRGQEWSTAAGPLAAKYNAQRLRLMTGEMPSCPLTLCAVFVGEYWGPRLHVLPRRPVLTHVTGAPADIAADASPAADEATGAPSLSWSLVPARVTIASPHFNPHASPSPAIIIGVSAHSSCLDHAGAGHPAACLCQRQHRLAGHAAPGLAQHGRPGQAAARPRQAAARWAAPCMRP